MKMARVASLFLQPFVYLNRAGEGVEGILCLFVNLAVPLLFDEESYTPHGPSLGSEQRNWPQIASIPLPRPVAPLLHGQRDPTIAQKLKAQMQLVSRSL